MTAVPNIGVIGLRGAWSTEKISDHLARRNAGGAVIELSEISYDGSTGAFSHSEHSINDFDGFIIKKLGSHYSSDLVDQLDLLALLERKGIRFSSSPGEIKKMISRLGCTLILRENNIPMPPTYVTQDIESAVNWIVEQGTTILKPLYSTKARGMVLIEDPGTGRKVLEEYLAAGERTIYLQKKLELSGTDYALAFLDGTYIGAYSRVGDGTSWHTTTEKGGAYTPVQPTREQIEMATRAQASFGLDFACVDIAESREMGSIVFEVSAFGGYRGLLESSDLDASELVVDFVLDQLLRS